MKKPLSYSEWLINDFANWLEDSDYISPAVATPNELVQFYRSYKLKLKSYCFDDCECGDLAYHKYLADFSKEE